MYSFENLVNTLVNPSAWAPVDPVALSVAAAGAALLALAVAIVRGRGQRRHIGALEERLASVDQQLAAVNLLLAETTSDMTLLRQRSDEIANRQESSANTALRSGFRQAIALSRHGATARQLMDTCGLSQGEAHLIQTLYGRAEAIRPSTESEGIH